MNYKRTLVCAVIIIAGIATGNSAIMTYGSQMLLQSEAATEVQQ